MHKEIPSCKALYKALILDRKPYSAVKLLKLI